MGWHQSRLQDSLNGSLSWIQVIPSGCEEVQHGRSQEADAAEAPLSCHRAPCPPAIGGCGWRCLRSVGGRKCEGDECLSRNGKESSGGDLTTNPLIKVDSEMASVDRQAGSRLFPATQEEFSAINSASVASNSASTAPSVSAASPASPAPVPAFPAVVPASPASVHAVPAAVLALLASPLSVSEHAGHKQLML